MLQSATANVKIVCIEPSMYVKLNTRRRIRRDVIDRTFPPRGEQTKLYKCSPIEQQKILLFYYFDVFRKICFYLHSLVVFRILRVDIANLIFSPSFIKKYNSVYVADIWHR